MTVQNLPARRTRTAVATVQPTPPTVRYVPNRQARRDVSWIGWLLIAVSGVLSAATLLGLLAANPL